ncbi:aquaporin-12-like [Pelobates fuscus]|uniref:aquaporin-12-like n=1 Tax=Pelobates fuscus TaxID=191477 RepID=UPI002FE448AA
MAGLNILVTFFVTTVVLSQLLRYVSKKLLPSRLYQCTISELSSAFQLCACFMELRMLMEIGMWGGGFGPDVIMTLLFLLTVTHGFTFSGASANSAVSLQEFLLRDCPLIDTLSKILSQYLGMEAAKVVTSHYWALELTEFHTIQNMMAQECSSALQTSPAQGVFVEGLCAFCYHLVILRFQRIRPVYKSPVTALTVTLLVHAAGSYTGGFFNPTLALSLTFHCSGASLQDYALVYWVGSLIGMVLALFLHEGNIPLLFQRNLLYNQKGKYKTPKRKTLQATSAKTSGDVKSPSKKKTSEAGQRRPNNEQSKK